ncbi:nucleotidyltransferase [Kutzneria buriramensis]|uniref:Cyclic GMP-AMP synthase n=1 Tax=Kutzneria buriramensis TaxID=1045776 RepID=A0A3E0GUN5_9PSEU|nr:nucleotidyltransferase [Kutzneria buriramensis]REH28652.1 hypothetical protein BCF44_12694 [Kutzneria buriramensis]
MNDDSLDALSELLSGSADLLDIPPETRDAAVGKYQDVGNFLADTGGEDWDIYPQGSFLTGTVIRPPTSCEYDIDLVCRHLVEKSSTTQDKLKELVGGWLAEYHAFKLATQADEAPDKFLEKRRCWTFSYERLGFHLDVLPCIPDAELKTSPHGILLTDTKLRPWQHGNPTGYATWFRNRSEEMLTKIAKRALEANVADVPNWTVRSTLQRLVQVLKWHCYLHFGTDVDDRPPSILITTLAAHAYQGQSNLANALLSVTQDMDSYIEKDTNGNYEVLNPAHPRENFTDKWNEADTAHRQGKFRSWLDIARRDLELVYQHQGDGIPALVDRLGEVFERDVIVKSAENWGADVRTTTSNRKLMVARGVAGLTTAGSRTATLPTFYGREYR